MTPTLGQRLRLCGDQGMAMAAAILVMAVVGVLTVTAASLTVNNIQNSSRDRQSLGALSSSEAGVAQAIEYLRGIGLANLTCTEPAVGASPDETCTTSVNSWVNALNPMQVGVDGRVGACTGSSDCFKVWIGTINKYVPSCPARHALPPGHCVGTYRIHSTGLAGNGPGARRLAVDVQVRPMTYPLGVFAEQGLSGNGNVGLHYQSIFTPGCIFNRQDDSQSGSGLQFAWDPVNGRPALDMFYDQPAAAHAVGNVSTSNNSCGSDAGGRPVHQQAACNLAFKFDQDGGVSAGPLSIGSGCLGAYLRSDGTSYPTTSKFTLSELTNTYGYRPRGLTDAQYSQLRSTAQSQGTYNLVPASISGTLSSLAAAGISSPVLYWDNGPVSLKATDFPPAFLRNLDGAGNCQSNNLTLVVTGGSNSLTYQGGSSSPLLAAAIFVPDGVLRGHGGRNTIGTIYAKTIDLGGNVDFYMDSCFANNPPGAALEIEVLNWREDDGTDAN